MTATPTPAPESYGNRLLVTIAVMSAALMQSVDISISNVAIPNMQGSLSATQDQVTWVLTSYIVGAAVMIPLSGWLARRYGRKRVLIASVAGFTLASVLCGAATTLPQLVIFRLLQGISGAALQPLAQSVLLDINPRERHGRAMATWSMGITVAPLFGPTLGGWITETYGWRWVFYINLPIGILALIGLMVILREQREPERRSFDFLGFTTLSIAIIALQMMLDRGQQNDWFDSPETVLEGSVAAIAFWIFVTHTATSENSFINPRVLQDRTFTACCAIQFIMSGVFTATLSLVQPLLQNQLGYPALASGWVVMPRSIANMVCLLVVGRVIGRVIDSRMLLALGLCLNGYGLWTLGQIALNIDQTPIIVASLLQGAGFACIFAPLSVTAFTTLRSEYRTEGAVLYSLVRNIGGSTGISIFQTVFSRQGQVNHEHLAAYVTPFNQALSDPSIQGFWDIESPGGLARLNQEVTRQALMMAYVEVFQLMAIVLICTLPLLLILRLKLRPARPSYAEMRPGAAEPAE